MNPKQSFNSRLETPFGNAGLSDSPGRLKLYVGRYQFMDRTWGIQVWAANKADAEEYCIRHGMVYGGEVLETGEL